MVVSEMSQAAISRRRGTVMARRRAGQDRKERLRERKCKIGEAALMHAKSAKHLFAVL